MTHALHLSNRGGGRPILSSGRASASRGREAADQDAGVVLAGNAAFRILVHGLILLLACLWTWHAGKDLNWDALAYHLYSGFSAVNDRFALDFRPAGVTSYLNPYASVPFFLMVRADWPSLLIGLTFTLFHAVNLFIVFELALEVQGQHRQRLWRTRGVAVLAVLLAFLNPVFLQELGSSFTDISTSVLILAAVWVLIRGMRLEYGHRAWLAGLLIGVAIGLKPTNSLVAVAVGAGLVLIHGGWPARLRRGLEFGVGAGAGFVVAAGPWAWKLWVTFGNPFFPMMNGLFGSPDFTSMPSRHLRFVPESLTAALARPFEMAVPMSMVHTEPMAPDTRYAALVALAAAALLAAGGRRLGCRPVEERPPDWQRPALAGLDPLPVLTLQFVLAWSLWLGASGNSRYFLPMGLLAGLLLACGLARLLSRSKWFVPVGAILLLLQSLNSVMGAEPRWNSTPWDRRWFPIDLPERFRVEPSLFLSLDMRSASFFLPYLAPGSGMINLSGGAAIAPSRPGADRVVSMVSARRSELRSLIELREGYGYAMGEEDAMRETDARLQRFGWAVDASDCAHLSLIEQPGNADGRGSSDRTQGSPVEHRIRYQTCRLVPASMALAEEASRRGASFDRLFEQVEGACPSLFRPGETASEQGASSWRRSYIGSDMTVWTASGRVFIQNATPGGGDPIVLGTVAEVTRSPPVLECSRRAGLRFPFP